MKASILALVLALALDGGLYWALRRSAREKADLVRRRQELAARVDALQQTGARGLPIEALLRTASESMVGDERPLDIAAFRDLLIGAERDLDLDRLSLDFRPAQDASKGREGGRVSATLAGSFDAVRSYLARVEGLRLPLAPEAFSLRTDDSGRVLLAIEWNGLWGLPRRALEELSPEEVARLASWLAFEPAPGPARSLFPAGDPGVEPPIPPPALERPAPLSPAEVTDSSLPPRLSGFVIARAELERDVNRRVLAALRFEEELRLVGVGEVVGSYRVEEIVARESVLLVHQESGERLRLFLE